jgi:hypothetical protein
MTSMTEIVDGSDGPSAPDWGELPEGVDDEPFDVPPPPVTGDPVVDDAVARVAEAAGQPLDHQVGVYDAVHRALQDRLADVED